MADELNNPTPPVDEKDKYFAAKKAEDCASVVLNKAQSFYNVLRSNAFIEKINRMWRAYHGAYNDDLGYGHRLNFTGEQGELVAFPVNHFRNIARHTLNMVTANRPVVETLAANTDFKSTAQSYLANGILDYYMKEKNLEEHVNKATELAIVLGAGYIKLDWNATGGSIFDVDPETGNPVYEGEIEFTTLSPLDVVVDGTKETWDNEWVLVRTFQNRHNLIAKYPEFSEKIKQIPPKTNSTVYRLAIWSNDDTDDIPVYEFYHRSTEALPNGRYLQFLDSDIVLIDQEMPYREIPVYRIAPAEILGTPYGYSDMFDAFPIQEALNGLYSAILTNNNAFAVQSLFVQRGSDINVNSLGEGMTIIEGNVKPEPLQLTSTPPETYKFLEMLIQAMETVTGVNSVTRGNPESSLRSGTSLALVQSMSLQFISTLQRQYVKLIETTCSGVINIIQDFVKTPKLIALVGKNNKSYLKQFIGDDITDIKRVTVNVGNPLSKTIAGRVQMAEQLAQMKLLSNPQQYFQVINTGRLDATFEGEMNQLLLIKRENEWLMEGKDVTAIMYDKHSMHIMEHQAVLADPELRENPELAEKVMSHIQQHIDYLKETDPAVLAMIGEQSIAEPPPQGPPPGQPNPPQGSLGDNPQVLQSPQSLPDAGESINQPNVQGVAVPSVAKVPGELLPNPELQQESLGNVKF